MRTFVAIEVDDKGILQKIKSVQKSANFKASPIRIDQIHFTLQFLGEIDEKLCAVSYTHLTLPTNREV